MNQREEEEEEKKEHLKKNEELEEEEEEHEECKTREWKTRRRRWKITGIMKRKQRWSMRSRVTRRGKVEEEEEEEI